MLGDFISRCLLMLFGYAYPAFECYKTVMRKSAQIEELRFWCQYWIIAALITIFERIGDIFISWLPLYGEMKLALFIYLWYPKTQGTGYVFDVLLRPYIIDHEPDIERKLQQWRAKVWDLTIFYWKNCTELGQSTVFQFFQYLASPSSPKSKHPVPEILKGKKAEREQPAPQSKEWFPFLRKSGEESRQERQNASWSPSAPPLDSAGAYRPVSEPHGARSETEYGFVDEGNGNRRGDDEFGRTFNDRTDRQHDINLVRRH